MAKKTTAPNRIAEMRKSRKMTQQQLADAIGAHWITVSKLERGVMRLSDEWREAIAKALGVDQWELVVGARSLPLIHVGGVFEEGGEVYSLDPENLSESFHLHTYYFNHPDFNWYLVAGEALWPWYQDGDRVCLVNMPEHELESVIGRICIVWWEKEGTKNDEEILYAVGVLEPGREAGKFTINRIGRPPVRDIVPRSLACVAMAVYYLGPNSLIEPDDLVQPFEAGPPE